jgi:hypothetical protein
MSSSSSSLQACLDEAKQPHRGNFSRRNGFLKSNDRECYVLSYRDSSTTSRSSSSDEYKESATSFDQLNKELDDLIAKTNAQSAQIDALAPLISNLSISADQIERAVSNYERDAHNFIEKVKDGARIAGMLIGGTLGIGAGAIVTICTGGAFTPPAILWMATGGIGSVIGMVCKFISIRIPDVAHLNAPQLNDQRAIWNHPDHPNQFFTSHNQPWDSTESIVFDPTYANDLIDPKHPDWQNPFIPLDIQHSFRLYLQGFTDANSSFLIQKFNLSPAEVSHCKKALFAILNLMRTKSLADGTAIIIHMMESFQFHKTEILTNLTDLAYALTAPSQHFKYRANTCLNDKEQALKEPEKSLLILRQKINIETRLNRPILSALQAMRERIFDEAINLILQDAQASQADKTHTFSHYYTAMARELGLPEIFINQAGNQNLIYASQENRIYRFFNEHYKTTKIVEEIEKLFNQPAFLQSFKDYLAFFFKEHAEEALKDPSIRFGSILSLFSPTFNEKDN